MKIVVSGASGNLGSVVVQSLQKHYSILQIGRNKNDYPWQLGVQLDPDEFQEASAFIHFAWSLVDRENHFHLNVGGTRQLANFAEKLGIPFIFISSISASGDSNYGRAKLLSERYVGLSNGFSIRVGLVPEANSYFKARNRHKISPIPNLNGRVLITEANDLSNYIIQIISENTNGKSKKSELITVTSGSVPVRELFRNKNGINLLIPNLIIKTLLKFTSKFSLKSRNNLDAYRSLISTLVKE
jgi:dTDP-4-dehydrorhamnose reductase